MNDARTTTPKAGDRPLPPLLTTHRTELAPRGLVVAVLGGLAMLALGGPAGCTDVAVAADTTGGETDAGPGDAPPSPETHADTASVPDVPVFPVEDVARDTSPSPDGAADGAGDGASDGGPDGQTDPCDGDQMPFFCPCEFNTQCESGYCIAVDDPEVAQRCTETCTDACPQGWRCQEIETPSDPVWICVQEIDTLCKPCFTDADCAVEGDLCMTIEQGLYCARDCSKPDAECPSGFTCTEVDQGGGQPPAMQCLPDTGSCLCGPEIDMTTDPANCGFCGHACQFDFAQPLCVGGECRLGPCEVGHWDLNGDEADGCEYACVKVSDSDPPDANAQDDNCDGIDGEVARGIFVSPAGKNSNPGTMAAPVNTIARAQELAQVGVRDQIYVAAGSYAGQLQMVDGVSVYGGYSADGSWERAPALNETIVHADDVDAGGAVRAVLFDGLSADTTLGGVTVQSANHPGQGGSSYGIWMRSVGPNARVQNCRIVAGNGAPGVSAPDRPKATDGAQGQPGGTTTDTDCNCNDFDTYGGYGGPGGASTCPDGHGAGGKGADSNCGEGAGNTGSPSPDGTPGGGSEAKGADGADGADGQPGVGGKGPGTVDANGLWHGQAGTAGTDGASGKGGGGGGSGKGDDGGWFGCAVWGGGGGGGGSGGCGGQGAQPGTAGGGSFGVFLVDASPTLLNLDISYKSGGNGGRGGIGGAPGLGRAGGAGGDGHKNATAGGAGGHGGDGGRGGNGGGGAGGPAYGIYLAGESAPSCAAIAITPLGVGGLGGVGGDPSGNAGEAGPHGPMNLAAPACDPTTW